MIRVHPFARNVALVVLLLLAVGSRPVAAAAAAEAQALFRRALALEERGTIETRRAAMTCLERATLLAPDSAEYQLALARVYFRMGFLKQARGRYQKVEKIAPENADARFGVGQVWRRDWLKYLDRVSLARAIESFSAAARLGPDRCDHWLALVPLYYEQNDLGAAAAAAEQALQADVRRPEAMLAVAYTAFRTGRLARAESTFVVALPRLPKNARERFEDIAPVASEQDTTTLRNLAPAARAEFVRRFWREHDPDLVTAANEAQLEYWARVTQAYFLYYNPRRREWDQRGEVYVRYGPPERADYNPVGSRLQVTYGVQSVFPMNTLLWAYPSLGMWVRMEDRLLSEYYLMPMRIDSLMDPVPNPEVLARRADLLSSRGGRGVFPVLPPGARPRPVSGTLARFEGARGPRLFAQVGTPGWPDDSLWAEWVVLDTAMVEVARGGRSPGASSCDPAHERVADFAAELPPGEYQVGISMRGADGRRGIYRAPASLRPAPTELALSDAVVTCGRPEVTVRDGAPAVHLEANAAAVIDGDDPLNVYFEMYDLRPDESGQARFEYEATVRSAERDSRFWLQRFLQPRARIPEISASRREEQPGSLRRQFVTVPVSALAAGRYRLDIKVRDLIAGSEAVTSVEFEKRSAAAAVPTRRPGS